mmetsp:Transcript_34342/g.38344  ORF Transcript_34342/g.38344 Transcript_34342/m.38344 type:complete len:662 (+) Transcript_34342:93-2078(+)
MTYAIPALQDRCDSVRISNTHTLVRFRAAQSSRSAFYHPISGPVIRNGYGPVILASSASSNSKNKNKARPQQAGAPSSAGIKRGREDASDDSTHNWNFRPSALQYEDYGNGTMSIQQIKELYVKDGDRALRNGVSIPPRTIASSSSSSSSIPLRCLQWNIQAFSSPFEERNLHTITPGIIHSIVTQEADVLVLNEIAWRDEKEWLHNINNINRIEEIESEGDEEYRSEHDEEEALRDSSIIGIQSKILVEEALQARGYTFIQITQQGDTPTMIASRRPVLQHQELMLSNNRSALCILIDTTPHSGSSVPAAATEDDHRDDNSNSSSSKINTTASHKNNYCWIVGTHLDAFDAEQRRHEIGIILQKFNRNHDNENDTTTTTTTTPTINPTTIPVLLMGDFNQQRQQDYTVHEWQQIGASAARRSVPTDDGVADLLQHHSFRCIYDDVVATATAMHHSNGGRSTTSTVDVVKCNWSNNNNDGMMMQHNIPPSTHWSGTTIDYTYYYDGQQQQPKNNTTTTRNTISSTPTHHKQQQQQHKLTPEGVYISPVGYSDHRMTVTDWNIHNINNDNNNINNDSSTTATDDSFHKDDENNHCDNQATNSIAATKKTTTNNNHNNIKKNEMTKVSLFNGMPPNRHHAWHNIHILDQYQLPQREQYWYWQH